MLLSAVTKGTQSPAPACPELGLESSCPHSNMSSFWGRRLVLFSALSRGQVAHLVFLGQKVMPFSLGSDTNFPSLCFILRDQADHPRGPWRGLRRQHILVATLCPSAVCCEFPVTCLASPASLSPSTPSRVLLGFLPPQSGVLWGAEQPCPQTVRSVPLTLRWLA